MEALLPHSQLRDTTFRSGTRRRTVHLDLENWLLPLIKTSRAQLSSGNRKQTIWTAFIKTNVDKWRARTTMSHGMIPLKWQRSNK